jgi:hypothetical protein
VLRDIVVDINQCVLQANANVEASQQVLLLLPTMIVVCRRAIQLVYVI